LKTFREFLIEKFLMSGKKNKTEHIDFFINPTKKEMINLLITQNDYYKSIRGILLKNGDCIMWKGNIMHEKALTYLTKYTNKTYQTFVIDELWYLENGYSTEEKKNKVDLNILAKKYKFLELK
jgi:hypothetical protein